jgi:endonuclease/exonuclease/phosphatase family metal-dependent hydrolase
MAKNAPYLGSAVVKRAKAKLGKSNKPGMCQQEVRQLFGVPSTGDFDRDGDADAHDAWKAAKARGVVVADRNVKNAPAGAYLYFSGGRNGHVALGLGGDSCISTDAAGRGRWGKAKISTLEKNWNREYEGYIVVTGHGYRVFPETKASPTTKTRYEVTASVLNGRSGPGTQYAIKTKRARGYRFNSSKRVGDWVQASKYWYHSDYLKEVDTAAPVELRIGTLNIPLDAEKIANGPKRAVIAAKQINDARLDVVAIQELSRAPGALSHNYSYRLESALGSNWQIVKPTASWNENYFFVRKGIEVEQIADLILPSAKGGRHMTRIKITKDKKTVYFGSTHLVSGKNEDAARAQQLQRIVDHIDSSWIVLGDLNQDHIVPALIRTHKMVRLNMANSATKWNTYAKYSEKKLKQVKGKFIDHIIVPIEAKLKGYNLVGVDVATGELSQPRASDHLLVIASIEI